MSELRLVEAVRETLAAELDRDDRVVVYGEDVGVDGGVFRATKGLRDAHPDRVFDVPLAESAIVGTGVGLAAAGMRPVPEVQFQAFLYQGFHQLVQHAARMRSRTRSTVACPMTIRTPYGGGVNAFELHSESYEAGFGHVPGLKVVVPSSPAAAAGLLRASVRDPDPVVFMEPTRLYRSTKEAVPEGPDYVLPLGEASVAESGEDVTVVAYGSLFRDAERAAAASDADVELIDLRTVSPLDVETVVASAKKTGRVVVVHEAPLTFGLGAEVAARVGEAALPYLEAPVERVAGFDVPYPMFAREDAYLPDSADVHAAIERVLAA